MNVKHHPAHHFKDAKQEIEASKLGLWIFLCTEILMFGGLFVAYAIYNNQYDDIFLEGSKFLDWKLGSINTVVLLVSSFTMALSIYYAQKKSVKYGATLFVANFYLWTRFYGN